MPFNSIFFLGTNDLRYSKAFASVTKSKSPLSYYGVPITENITFS